MGGGILGLPFAVAKLGLATFCVLLVAMAAFGVVSAWMLLIAMEEALKRPRGARVFSISEEGRRPQFDC